MASTTTSIPKTQSSKGITDIVRAILTPIASLNLTVFLLVLAVFVT